MTDWRARRARRQDRDDLAGEHKYSDAGQVAIAVLFGIVWVADTFMLEYTTFLNQSVPNSIRAPIGFMFVAASAFLARKGLSIVFDEKRENPGVIRKSVFGVVRHPIYLSEIVLYLGLLMFSLSLAAAAILFMSMFFFHYIAKQEEMLCLKRYGDEYRQYMHDVPMWIPRLWKKGGRK
jgi:protein-S-isoprenylcysteine O-methyltransferase Ste14